MRERSTLFRFSFLVLVFISGLIALSYESLWIRLVSTLLGSSNLGVALVFSSFMAGMGLGVWVCNKVIDHIPRPLLVYAILEVALAVYALILPSFIDSLSEYFRMNSSLSNWGMLEFTFCFVLLLLPAFVLGWSFPLFLKFAKNAGVTVSHLYGLNTMGGVVGAVFPLALLPIFGWVVSNRLIAVLAIFFAIAVVVFQFFTSSVCSDTQKPANHLLATVGRKLWVSYLLIGFAALGLEVAWSRLFGMLFIRTEYVAAIIVAVFLSGIGIGSLLAHYFKNKSLIPILLVGGSLVSLLLIYAVPLIASIVEEQQFHSLWESLFFQIVLLSAFTLPVTVCFGMLFPLLTKVYELNDLQVSRLYYLNTFGAALGSLITALLFFSIFGLKVTLVLLSFSLFVLGLFFWSRNYRTNLVLTSAFVVLSFPLLNEFQVKDLLPVSHADSKTLLAHESAMTSTHVVQNRDGHRLLFNDLHRIDASTEVSAVKAQRNQLWLPVTLFNPKSVLLLGVGTGITASVLTETELDKVHLVELSEGAINAARTQFKEINAAAVERFDVFQIDARRFLSASRDKYDLIMGDLFHPDMIGRSFLLSIQQFERLKPRLSEQGVYVQWLALNQFELKTLRIVQNSFAKVFPSNMIFVDGFRMAMIGFNHAPEVNLETSFTGSEKVSTWLGRYWGKVSFDSTLAVQDDWVPVIEYVLAAAQFNKKKDMLTIFSYLRQKRISYEQFPEKWKSPSLEKAYIASSMSLDAWAAGISGHSDRSAALVNEAWKINPDDIWLSMSQADNMFLSKETALASGLTAEAVFDRILDIFPQHEQSLQGRLQLAELAGDEKLAARLRNNLAEIKPW